jgi:hypothetical protein
MSRAHCNPALIESVAQALYGARGTIPRALSEVSEAISDLAAELNKEASQLEAAAREQASSQGGDQLGGRMSVQLTAIRRRIAAVTSVGSKMTTLRDAGARLDGNCGELAAQLALAATLVRDIMRSGMPAPNPSHVSASPGEIARSLRDVLDSAQVSGGSLPHLPSTGPERTGQADDAIAPADPSTSTPTRPWWDR